MVEIRRKEKHIRKEGFTEKGDLNTRIEGQRKKQEGH